MSTATNEVRCNARPTRLAFVVPTPDRDLLLSVIARATSLWGGIFNPIVILDGSTREVRGRQEQITSPAQYLEGQTDILKAFDPDFLPNFSFDPLPQELKEFQHRAFAAERLDWKPWAPMRNEVTPYKTKSCLLPRPCLLQSMNLRQLRVNS